MGIDAIAIIGHPFDLSTSSGVAALEALPHQLDWSRISFQDFESPAQEKTWRWELPRGCDSLRDAIRLLLYDPPVDVGLHRMEASLYIEPHLIRFATVSRWAIFAASPALQQAYREACGEILRAVGGNRCIYLPDALYPECEEPSLEEVEALLRQERPPVSSLAELCDAEQLERTGDLKRFTRLGYFIDQFPPTLW